MERFALSSLSEFSVRPDQPGSIHRNRADSYFYHVLISCYHVNVELPFRICACSRKWKERSYTWAMVWLSGGSIALLLPRLIRFREWQKQKQVQKTKIPSDTMISNMMSVERLDSNNPHWASEVFVRALKWTILLFPTIETFLSAQFPFIWKEKSIRISMGDWVKMGARRVKTSDSSGSIRPLGYCPGEDALRSLSPGTPIWTKRTIHSGMKSVTYQWCQN